MRTVLVVALCVTAALVALRRRYLLVTVTGASMAPVLVAGDRLLVRRGHRAPRAGSLVVFAPPTGSGWYVKRAVAVAGDPVPEVVPSAGASTVPAGSMVVLGEHPGSADSRQWGFVSTSRLLGVVVRSWRS